MISLPRKDTVTEWDKTIRVGGIYESAGRIQKGSLIDGPTHVLDLAVILLSIANPDDPLSEELWPTSLAIAFRPGTGSKLNDRLFYWCHSDIRLVYDGNWKPIAYGSELGGSQVI